MEQMEMFWVESVVPQTQVKSGMEFEFSMVVHTGTKWRHLGALRYANTPIIGQEFRI